MLGFLKKTNNNQIHPNIHRASAPKTERAPTEGKSYISKYCEELQKLDIEYASLMSKMNDSKSALASQQNITANITAKTSAMSPECESVSDKFSMFSSCLSKTRAKIEILENDIQKISSIISENRAQMDKTRSDTSQKADEMKEVDEHITYLRGECDSLKEEIKNFSKDLESEKCFINEFSSTNGVIQNSISKNKDMIEIINQKLIEQNEIFQTKKNDFSSQQDTEKRNKEEKSKILNSIQNIDLEIELLSNKIETLKKDISEKDNKRFNSRQEALDYERLMIPIKQNLNEASNKNDSIQNQLNLIKSSQNDLNTEIESLKREITNHQIQKTENEAKLQSEVMLQARLKGENQANSLRLMEADKNCSRIENEIRNLKNELSKIKEEQMSLQTQLVNKFGEAKNLLADDDTLIGQLKSEINEIKVKIDLVKNKQNASKMLQQHIKKTEEEIHSFSSQIQNEVAMAQKSFQKSTQQQHTIIPTFQKATGRGRILQLD